MYLSKNSSSVSVGDGDEVKVICEEVEKKISVESLSEVKKVTKDEVKKAAAALAEAVEVRAEGAKTHTIDERYKVTVTQPITRRVDGDAWEKICEEIPSELRPVKLKTTLTADDAGCRYLMKNEPDTWRKCATAITEKPGAVGVKVEELF